MNSMKKNQFVRICKSIAIHYYRTGKVDIKCENKSGKVLVIEYLLKCTRWFALFILAWACEWRTNRMPRNCVGIMPVLLSNLTCISKKLFKFNFNASI